MRAKKATVKPTVRKLESVRREKKNPNPPPVKVMTRQQYADMIAGRWWPEGW
jgi:hypothetical protein